MKGEDIGRAQENKEEKRFDMYKYQYLHCVRCM